MCSASVLWWGCCQELWGIRPPMPVFIEAGSILGTGDTEININKIPCPHGITF